MSDSEVITTVLLTAICFSGLPEKAMGPKGLAEMVIHMLSISTYRYGGSRPQKKMKHPPYVEYWISELPSIY